MILFDYGQTIIAQDRFDGVRGTAAVMKYAVENRKGLTPEQVQKEVDTINRELKRFDPASRARNSVEIPNYMFTAYRYESLGIKLNLTAEEIDRIFWEDASPGKLTEEMQDFLDYLWVYVGSVVSERINRLLPANHFEFILATSEYLFRKPNPRIFRFALEKAGLSPEDVWYIGDDYACDVEGARNAGIFPVWYQGAIDFEQADYKDVLKISAWSELRKILEKGEV